MSETRFKEAAEEYIGRRLLSDEFPPRMMTAFIAGASHGYAQGREEMQNTCAEFERVAQGWKRRAESAEARVKELEGALKFIAEGDCCDPALEQELSLLREVEGAARDCMKPIHAPSGTPIELIEAMGHAAMNQLRAALAALDRWRKG